ncbi:hypothetical protein [Paraburkholderia sp. WSM4175]|uniref:hypothetical protein n=1 Tax=Paraburkholderia sp. WSM4175 TaxID=2991072 RepID=UPI003D1AA941
MLLLRRAPRYAPAPDLLFDNRGVHSSYFNFIANELVIYQAFTQQKDRFDFIDALLN